VGSKEAVAKRRPFRVQVTKAVHRQLEVTANKNWQPNNRDSAYERSGSECAFMNMYCSLGCCLSTFLLAEA
jgi:hypothetical protein